MRSERVTTAAALVGCAAAAAVAGAVGVACESRDCTFDATCLVGDSGTDGPITFVYPPGCNPEADPKDSPACVDDSVGVFVSPSGVDGRAGTKAEPLKTLAGALSVVGQNRARIYVCGTAPLVGPIRVSGGNVTGVYGGFDCATWGHVGARVRVATAPGFGDPGLDVVNATFPVAIQDLEIVGPVVGAPNNFGARVVGPATRVTLSRVILVAGDGADGAAGKAADFPFSDASLLAGGASGDAKGGAPGGTLNGIACFGGGVVTKGGAGGDDGADGKSGIPDRGAGAGGTVAACGAGTGGGDGGEGPSGKAGQGASVLGKASGTDWTPQAGGVGESGQPGQGGGGGAGTGGGGGGGGGAGGCGGAGGGGGGGGGASAALAVIGGAQVKLVACELRAGKAGRGGSGGVGQLGQAGGTPGAGFGSGCGGGAGGKGGDGAPGGGGAGGVSACVLYTSRKPDFGADTKLVTGQAGGPGAGGGAGATDGVAGQAVETFAAP